MPQAHRRAKITRPKPQMRRMLSEPSSISDRSRRGVRKQNRGRCDQVWFAIRCPSSQARCTISGYCSARFPTTKNVAFTFFSRSKSSNLGVSMGLGSVVEGQGDTIGIVHSRAVGNQPLVARMKQEIKHDRGTRSINKSYSNQSEERKRIITAPLRRWSQQITSKSSRILPYQSSKPG